MNAVGTPFLARSVREKWGLLFASHDISFLSVILTGAVLQAEGRISMLETPARGDIPHPAELRRVSAWRRPKDGPKLQTAPLPDITLRGERILHPVILSNSKEPSCPQTYRAATA